MCWQLTCTDVVVVGVTVVFAVVLSWAWVAVEVAVVGVVMVGVAVVGAVGVEVAVVVAVVGVNVCTVVTAPLLRGCQGSC